MTVYNLQRENGRLDDRQQTTTTMYSNLRNQMTYPTTDVPIGAKNLDFRIQYIASIIIHLG